MQASNKWTPPKGVLGDLVRSTEDRVRTLVKNLEAIERWAASSPPPPPFTQRLQGQNVAVIAEVKRSSPSKGPINPGLDVGAQCKAYETGGAAAISVLTEPTRFGGDVGDLAEARHSTTLPLLRKDFIIDESQILEARGTGASAVLLIVRALDPRRLEDLFQFAGKSGLDALVEVRDAEELETALSIGATVIGVNNRNLETLEIDDAAASLLPRIPGNCIAVAESGYKTAADVKRAAAAGADAVLIGSELSSAANPANLLRELTSINRMRNARPD